MNWQNYLGSLGAVMLSMVTTLSYADTLSTSVMRPTLIDPATGVIRGDYPGGAGETAYYFSTDLEKGDLVTQISFKGRKDSGEKRLEFQILNTNMSVKASYYVYGSAEANQEATKSFPIDSAGHYNLRLIVKGPETTKFCVLLGGTALPSAKSPGCEPPAPPAATPPIPPPPPKQPFEVLESKCEQRLRIGSDILFEFDRFELLAGAEPTLDAVAEKIRANNHSVTIEGYTDSKGTDEYNLSLSEKRAASVKANLIKRDLLPSRFKTQGFGKAKPVAPNENKDGSDNPEGRQHNRRVEIVINTCE